MTRNLPIVAVCLLVSGCASPLTQSSRSENASQHQASTGSSQAAVDIVDKTVTQPKPTPAPPSVGTLTVSGENNKVEVVSPPPAPPTATAPDTRDTRVGVNSESKGSTSDSWWASFESSTSLTIIGWALGLGLLAMILYAIIRAVKSGAFGAGAAVVAHGVDEQFAAWAREARTTAMNAATPEAKASALADLAEIEAARGRLAAKQP
jgi:hypothetical protein